ncbi:Alpha amylase, catalytic domain containing protein [Trichomonas vaginalis G3]|uniref:Alpha amylase, catalytic domain containing protein n=1 Tax=Trichomonas vaginalis (strain ATCC PRA-98 / G3) TaxID=412133 RepID=A2E4F7_TRIV3|nr:alpha-1,4-glucan:maltose-1-phosphate maltosyltransferase family [Trichomonas vaginalis G3]EAY12492.1 Alpha amylase, catalytic domain containing protein [Trichomonas vaginalis G3]KAI5539553.1 alpha-1,4-glucan:maltose-1-phosphate maltosyltransferase family [Trichomonas vaginalis G3]|eukprot:XP_001324715.1 Alpha amylase, catalytic domain containing protein [Trichomonas vaginalis G3]
MTSFQPPTNLLEITTRPYLYGLSKKIGKQVKTFKDIPESEFKSWKDKGFQWIWFMGVWQVGEFGPHHDRTDPGLKEAFNHHLPGWTDEDVIGSPYSITEYKLNKELGTEADLKWLRQKLHSYGMKLMVDFVPNHSACDAPEIKTKPNFYIRCPQGENPDKSKYLENGIAFGCGMWCSPWTDVAQYNYADLKFRKHQITVLKYIASVADGCRCDMAHLIINDEFCNYWQKELVSWGYAKPSTEFWEEAISAVKKQYPDFKFMAESYGDVLGKLHHYGFDWAYDKDPLDKLYAHDMDGYQHYIANHSAEFFSKTAHFTENHDEPRTVEKFWDWHPAAMCAAATLLTLPGVRFFFQDQWLGYKNRIAVHLRRAVDEEPKPHIVEFYNVLFEVLKKDALQNGKFQQLWVNGSSTIPCWKWSTDKQNIIIAANFGENKTGGYCVINDFPGNGEVEIKELFSGEIYKRNAEEIRSSGLIIVLEQYQVQIFEY